MATRFRGSGHHVLPEDRRGFADRSNDRICDRQILDATSCESHLEGVQRHHWGQAVWKRHEIALVADSALGESALESGSLSLRGLGECIGSSTATIGCNGRCCLTAWKIMSARRTRFG